VALKPVIYKLNLNLSDLNRHYYETINLTIAQHPSETTERMMARIVAFCFNAQESLTFTKGLSETDEPDLWVKTLDDQIALWIDVGEPAVDRIKKASRLTQSLKVYSFNSKTDVWWSQSENKFKTLPAAYFKFEHTEIEELATHLERTMKWFVTISEDTASINTENGECDVKCIVLHDQN